MALLGLLLVPGATAAAPRLEYSPARFDVETPAGGRTGSLLSLRNTGDAVLELTLSVRDGRLSATRAPGTAAGVAAPRVPGDPGPAVPASFPERNAAPWAAGPGPLAPLPVPDAPRATRAALRVLVLHCGGEVSALRAQLAAFPEFQAVDVRDLSTGPVPPAALLGYEAVLVAINTSVYDPDLLGDALADYRDAGGGIVLTLASFVSGYEVRGRLLLESYSPFLLASGPGAAAELGAHEPGDPVMSAVSTLHGELIADPPVAPGARRVASWSDGRPLVATRPGIAGLNLFTALPGYASGDVALLLRNALLWSAGRSPWLRPPVHRVSLPPGGESVLELVFDAEGLAAGTYGSELVLAHNDPGQAEVRIPAGLVVRGAPRMRLSGGDGIVESTRIFGLQGEETSHRLVVGTPAPDTLLFDLRVEGDYGDGGEFASAAVEGVTVAFAGQVGVDCQPALRTVTLLPQLVHRLLDDGVVDATVRNTDLVDPLCQTNRHTVRLRFERPPDPIETGSVFVGAASEGSLHVRNTGTDLLRLHSVRASDPAFVPDRDSLTVAPGATGTVRIRFTPGAVGEATATLALSGNDPLAPEVALGLHGRGLAPPDADVQPGEVGADLGVGGIATRVVELRNLGESPLAFRLRARSHLRAGGVPPGAPGGTRRPGRAAPPFEPFPDPPAPVDVASRAGEEPPLPGDGAHAEGGPEPRSGEPGALAPRTTAPMGMPGANVLLVQDAAPWATLSIETVLSGEGVAFDRIGTAGLDTLDLGRYAAVILAADQPTPSYLRLRDLAERLEDYVGAGGVLEVHAAGWGYSGGDASQLVLPGGVGVRRQTSDFDHVSLPDHPLAGGLPATISGTSPSHAWFSGLPGSADVVVRDDFGFPVLAAYALGRGMVVASGMTQEFAFAHGQAAGPVLENLVRYSLAATPQWLAFSPPSGVIPPGGTFPVTLTFDATDLDGGTYGGEVLVSSDDPDEPVLGVQASLRVTGAPDLDVLGRTVVVESRAHYIVSGALTTHRLAMDRPPGTPVAIELEISGDFNNSGEDATLAVEGLTLGVLGPLPGDCPIGRRVFVLPPFLADHLLADGVLDVQVQNSVLVDPSCAPNHHRVRAAHAESPFPLRFADTFAGACDQRGFLVRNRGTEPLVVGEVSAAPAAFRASPTSFTVAPRHEQVVAVEFCPGSPGFAQGLLTVASDDPDTPSASLVLSGTARAAPVLVLAEQAISADLLAGERTIRTIELRNAGGSPLELRLLARAGLRLPAAPAAAAPAAVARTAAGAGPDAGGGSGPPAFARATPAEPLPPRAPQAAARVLIVEDFAPWGRLLNEALLDSMGIAWDRASAEAVAATDLSRYSVVLLAGDQNTNFYALLSGQAARLEAYVEQGGTLQAHLSGWGSNLGDASILSLPGGVGVRLRLADRNRALAPGHPLLAGVPDLFTGTFASHGFLVGLPAGTLELASDPEGGVTLAEYGFGQGRVIVGTQPFEYGLAADQPAGTILRNLIPYALAGAGGWLSLSERRATVAPGDSLRLETALETSLLGPGAYAGEVQVTSNDPKGPFRSIPVELRVANVPAALRLERRGLDGGHALAASLTLPGGLDPAGVRLATVRLNGVPADTARAHTDRGGGDDDATAGGVALRGEEADQPRGGRPRRLRLRFDREAVLGTLGAGPEAVLLLTGALAGADRFLARDTVALAFRERGPDDDGGDDWVAGGAAGRAAGPAPPATASLRLGPNPLVAGPLLVELAMPRAGPARVEVFSLDGRLVRPLASGAREAGVHRLEWDGRDAAGRASPAGVYLVRVRAPGLAAVRRVIRLK
jgi:hypothetical protein